MTSSGTSTINFTDAARHALGRFIEGATRFTPDTLRIEEEQSLSVTIDVRVTHQVQTHLEESTESGCPDPDRQDLVASTEDEYESLSESLLEEAEDEFKVVNHLAKTIASRPYGHYVGDTDLGDYPRSVHFTYECNDCEGSGEVRCNRCGGSGDEMCIRCGGMGHTHETQWGTDNDGNSTSTSSWEHCHWCMGTGRETCSTCNGQGSLVCGACDGQGELTDTATPAYVVASIYQISQLSVEDEAVEYALKVRSALPELGQGLARIATRDVTVQKAARRVVEQLSFVCPFFKARVTLNGKTASMVVFGENCRISNAGELIETLVQADFEALRTAVEEMSLLNVLANSRAKRAIRVFLESEIHQQAIEFAPSANGLAGENQLTNKLARALGEGYLHDAIDSVERFASGIYSGTKYMTWMLAAPCLTASALHFWSHQAYWMLAASQTGIVLLTLLAGQWLIKSKLRKLGGQRLLDFAIRRGRVWKGGFAWPW